jgi:integrase/recombinase XerD
LTAKGEHWIRETLPKFEKFADAKGVYLLEVTRDDIRDFLSSLNGVWNRHSHFRAVRAFYNWLEREKYIELSPCYKLQAPKLPRKVMPRPTLPQVKTLIESSDSARNKAIICLLMDLGLRNSELASIKPEDIDWQRQTVKVWGKGAKQRVGKFSDTTASYLREHLATYTPNGNVWGINQWGIAIMLKRLGLRTGITCNPHSFRRAWAIETIKTGTNLIDVEALGGWESLEMVRHYAREVSSEDAIERYRPVMSTTEN